MNCDSTRNSVQGLQSVILLINDTSSSSSSLEILYVRVFHFIVWQSSLEINPNFVIGSSWSGFCHTDHFHGNGHKPCISFVFESRQIQNLQLKRVPCNKLLTNLACSSRTGEYWPSIISVQSSLRSVRRTATTSGQNFPVRPSRSVSNC